MRRNRELLIWAVFLLLAGVFLLLKNKGVLDPWGEVAWGGFFAAVGLAFVIWLLVDRRQWWRAIPGFILLTTGGLVLLNWRGISLGVWTGSSVMFGIALGFWVVLLLHSDNWWAEIPAGVLTVLGLLMGFQTNLTQLQWLAALYVGLGLVFGILYVIRLSRGDTWWAAIPATALILLGITTWTSTLPEMQAVLSWWPVLLLLAGLVLVVVSVQRSAALANQHRPEPVQAPPQLAPAPAGNGKPTQPAPAPQREHPAPAQEPAAETPSVPESSVNIYDLLKNQPPAPAETQPGEPPSEPAAGDSPQPGTGG